MVTIVLYLRPCFSLQWLWRLTIVILIPVLLSCIVDEYLIHCIIWSDTVSLMHSFLGWWDRQVMISSHLWTDGNRRKRRHQICFERQFSTKSLICSSTSYKITVRNIPRRHTISDIDWVSQGLKERGLWYCKTSGNEAKIPKKLPGLYVFYAQTSITLPRQLCSIYTAIFDVVLAFCLTLPRPASLGPQVLFCVYHSRPLWRNLLLLVCL